MHIVVVDHKTGKILLSEAFDTYTSSRRFDSVFVNLNTLDDGNIIVAACKDECIHALSNQGKEFFEKMGSKEIWKVKYRHSFAFIGVF